MFNHPLKIFTLIALPMLSSTTTYGIEIRFDSVMHSHPLKPYLKLVQFFPIAGEELPSSAPVDDITREDGKLKFKGIPGNFAITYGPYHHIPDNSVIKFIEVKFHIKAKFTPNTYKTCRKRNYTQKCISWNHHAYDHGFRIDLVSDIGENTIRSLVLRGENLERLKNGGTYVLDMEVPPEGIEYFEARVISPFGGVADIEVEKIVIRHFGLNL